MLSRSIPPGLLESLELGPSELDEFTDEEIAAEVAAALPRFVADRLRRTVPFAMAALILLAVAIKIPSSSGPTTPTVQGSAPGNATAVRTNSGPPGGPTRPTGHTN